MHESTANLKLTAHGDAPKVTRHPRDGARIRIVPLGMALGTFLAITFVFCVLFDLWFPGEAMNAVWAPLLPGFTWISWASFFLGFIEAFAYGWYIALVFGPLYNFFAAIFSAPR